MGNLSILEVDSFVYTFADRFNKFELHLTFAVQTG